MDNDVLDGLEQDTKDLDRNLEGIRDELPTLIDIVKTTRDMEELRKASKQVLFNLVICLESIKTTNEFYKLLIRRLKEFEEAPR